MTKIRAVIVRDIERGAALMITEGDNYAPKVVRYTPHPHAIADKLAA